ncbi:MAG: DUF481 domain-containing protein [Myxococcales bacterium]|nr:DUF481 domain-containing protein [Myxococcales bacterium]
MFTAASFALCASASSSAAAAPVNAESLRPNLFRAGWSGGLDANFALSRGNIDLLDVGGAGRVQYQRLYPSAPVAPPAQPELPWVHHRVFLTATGRFADRAGAPFVSQAFAHLRWTAMWHRRVGSDLFAQHQYNEFQRLRGRTLLGAGVRVEIVHAPVFMLSAGSGYMLEYERINVLEGAPDPPETLAHRWTNYLTARLSLWNSALLVQNTLYVQPRFDAPSDVRLLEELEVLAKVTDVFGLGVTASVAYDSAPPTGVRETELRVFSTVRLSF